MTKLNGYIEIHGKTSLLNINQVAHAAQTTMSEVRKRVERAKVGRPIGELDAKTLEWVADLFDREL